MTRVLCTSMMPERHTAANTANGLSETIKECGKLIFCAVFDNASKLNLARELCKMFPKAYSAADNKDWFNPGLSDEGHRGVSHFHHSAGAACTMNKLTAWQKSILQAGCSVRWNGVIRIVTLLHWLFNQRTKQSPNQLSKHY